MESGGSFGRPLLAHSSCLFKFLMKAHQDGSNLCAGRMFLRGEGRCCYTGNQAVRLCPSHRIHRVTADHTAIRKQGEIRCSRHVVRLMARIAIEYHDQLFPCNRIVGAEFPIAVSINDLIRCSPHHRIGIILACRYIGKTLLGGSWSPIEVPENGYGHSACCRFIGGKSSRGYAGHEIAFVNVLHFVIKPICFIYISEWKVFCSHCLGRQQSECHDKAKQDGYHSLFHTMLASFHLHVHLIRLICIYSSMKPAACASRHSRK